ncbi:hypothetical protein T484DRAFT_1815094 [Baffinella frigidus]|nr:hypothetical protein T484DRAFT_1815094 [Cryptophyta sp. CCMP2293]
MTINMVLQCSIDFLTCKDGSNAHDEVTFSDKGAAPDLCYRKVTFSDKGAAPDLCYRKVFISASVGIAYGGSEGTILEVNPALSAMLGYEVLGTDQRHGIFGHSVPEFPYGTDQRHKLVGRNLLSLICPSNQGSTNSAAKGSTNSAAKPPRYAPSD